MKLTQWFPSYIAPVRPGVYQRRFVRGKWFWARWNGKRWFRPGFSRSDAENVREISAHQISSMITEWRGLAEEPK